MTQSTPTHPRDALSTSPGRYLAAACIASLLPLMLACAPTAAAPPAARVGSAAPAESASLATHAFTPQPPGSVHFIYLVSADREVRTDYLEALEQMARGLHRFFARELGGWTFDLPEPPVSVLLSSRPALWFTTNPAGPNPDDWGFHNTRDEIRRLVGEEAFTHRVFSVHSDGPGDKGRGGSLFAYMPEDDLLGLVGRHPTQPSQGRWVAGAAHELGHAFGLPHPPEPFPPHAIMGAGFYHCWPRTCELTAQDKQILGRSAFFRPGPDAPETLLGRWHFHDGVLLRLRQPGGRVVWQERKFNAGQRFLFDEIGSGGGLHLLHDRSRDLKLKVPERGGMVRIQIADGPWRDLFAAHPR